MTIGVARGIAPAAAGATHHSQCPTHPIGLDLPGPLRVSPCSLFPSFFVGFLRIASRAEVCAPVARTTCARLPISVANRISIRRWAARLWLSPLLVAAALCATTTVGPARARAAEAWLDAVRVEPFICRADFPLVSYGQLFEELQRLQSDLVQMLQVPAADRPIDLYLFRDRSSYRSYLARHLPDVPYRRALFVKTAGQGHVYAYRSRELGVDLRHEATHALLHAALPTVPLWLDEGLAEYFEVPRQQRVNANPHLIATQSHLQAGNFPRLEALEAIIDLTNMHRDQYRDAWAWVHFMMHGPPEAHDELVRYLRDLETGRRSGLLSRRLPQRVPDVKRRFAAHFRQWR